MTAKLDVEITQILVNLAKAKARAKHPEFVYNDLHYLCTLVEEYIEYYFALAFQNAKRVQEEKIDILVLRERRLAGDGTLAIPWWNPRWIIRAWTKENREIR